MSSSRSVKSLIQLWLLVCVTVALAVFSYGVLVPGLISAKSHLVFVLGVALSTVVCPIVLGLLAYEITERVRKLLK